MSSRSTNKHKTTENNCPKIEALKYETEILSDYHEDSDLDPKR